MSTEALDDAPAGQESAIVRWLGKSFGALADQGLFSAGNFLLNLCLAGWLSAREYGAFAVGFTIFCLLGAMYSSLVLIPVLVFGPGQYRERVGDYLGALLGIHGVFAVAAGVLLAAGAVACWMADVPALALTLFGLAIAQPWILLLWLCRRACYIRYKTDWAAGAGVAYLAMMLLGVLTLKHLGCLSILGVVAVMGVGSLVVSVWLLMRLKVTRPDRLCFATIRGVVVDHWQYGRWSLPTTLVNYLAFNSFCLLLPIAASIEECGALRALTTLIVPMLQVIIAISALLLPRLVETRGTAGRARVVRIGLWVMVGGPVAYWLVLGAVSGPIIDLLYHGHYSTHAKLLWLVGVLPILEGLTVIPALILQANGRVDCTFRAALGAALGGLAIGVPLLLAYGLAGAVMGMAIYSLFQGVLLWRYCWQGGRRLPDEPRSGTGANLVAGSRSTESPHRSEASVMHRHVVRDRIKRTITTAMQWAGSARRGKRSSTQVVLCYHSISGDANHLAIRPEVLREQIRLLKEMGYTFYTYSGLVEAIHQRPESVGNAVALTFDDGLEDNYLAAMPVLLEAGVKATFFISTGLVTGDREAIDRYEAESGCTGGYLNADQLREMVRQGMELGAHTHSHYVLASLSPALVRWELTHSKEVLEQLAQTAVTSMSYPYGTRHLHYSEQVCELARQAGYRTAARLVSRSVNPPGVRSSLFHIPRICISKDDTPDLFVQKCQGYFDWFGVYQEWRGRWRAAMSRRRKGGPATRRGGGALASRSS